MNVLKRLLPFVAGGMLGCLIGVSVLFYYVAHQMEKNGFVPVGVVMKSAGYSSSATDKDEIFSFENQDTRITLSNDYSVVSKNEAVFDAESKFRRTLYRLYVDKEYIENVLGGKIEKVSPLKYVFHENEPVRARSIINKAVPFVAHAGGGFLVKNASGRYRILDYTNSLEVVCKKYNEGFRAFEIDISFSLDGELCCIHDWKRFGEPVTEAQFLSDPTEGGYTSMSFKDFMNLMNQYPDMIMVLDIKSYNLSKEEILQKYQRIVDIANEMGGSELLNRIIPQIYNFDEYELVKQAYPWDSIILTLYRMKKVPEEDVISFVSDKEDIQIVTIPKSGVNRKYSNCLHECGKKVYTHTINDIDGLFKWINKGVDGFYTDIMNPADYLVRYS